MLEQCIIEKTKFRIKLKEKQKGGSTTPFWIREKRCNRLENKILILKICKSEKLFINILQSLSIPPYFYISFQISIS